MPRIPTYEQQTRATGPLGPGPSEPASPLASLAQSARQLAAFAQQKTEEQAIVSANGELMDARSAWLTQLEQRKQNAPDGAAEFTPGVLKDFDADASERMKRAATPKARQYLQERLGQVRLGLQQDAMQFEAAAIVSSKIAGLNNSVESARTALDFRPGDFGSIAEEQLTAIANSGLEPTRQAEIATKAKAMLASAAVGGMIRRNPYAALKELDNEKSSVLSVRALDYPDRLRMRQDAETEIRRREAEDREAQTRARQALADRVEDAKAAYMTGIPVTAPPTRADFVSVYPADQRREADRQYRSFTIIQQLGADLQSASRMTPSEQMQLLEKRTPTQVEGAAATTQAYSVLASHVAGLQRDLEKDPAEYVNRFSTGVKTASDALAQAPSPQNAQAYASSSIAAQRALGVGTPRLLTERQSHDVSERLKLSGNGEDVVGSIAQERDTWGRYWPQVLAEAAPKLNPAVQVIALGMDAIPAARLASVAAMKSEDLSKVLPSNVKPVDVELAVRDEMQDFSETLIGLAGSEDQLARLDEAATKLATSYIGSGEKLSKAAERAAREVVLNRYEVKTWRGNALRMPTGTASDLVITGLSSVDARVKRDLNLRGTDARWRTLPDDSGVVLEDAATGRPLTFGGPTLEQTMSEAKRTTLSADEEQKYRAWLERIGMTRARGYNMDDSYTGDDYDLRGFFEKYGPVDMNVRGGQHFTDEFKLPNHETFSNESRFAVGDATGFAGHWQGDTYIRPDRRPGALVSFSYDELAQQAVNRAEEARRIDVRLRESGLTKP